MDALNLDLEVFRNLFISIAEEMGVVLRRTAFSANIKERRDFSCAVYDRRAETVGDVDRKLADRMLREADCSVAEADEIYKLTALCTFDDRFVIPPMYREQAIEMIKEPHEHRSEAGFGFVGGPRRGL